MLTLANDTNIMHSYLEQGKYYLPDISEFHTGFIYERLRGFPEFWEKQVVGRYTNINSLFIHNLNHIRVKHLDEIDILSLGWEESSRVEESAIIYELNDYGLVFWRTETYIEIDIVGYDLGFSGYVKNKNEFLRIMKQIGVIPQK